MSSENREMIGYKEISNDPDLKKTVAELLQRFPDGTVSDLLNVFFSNKDGVPRDVFDYFCTSDFFSLFVDEAAEIVRKLIDFKAERGWYELIEDVCRNQKSVALYCKEIYQCFTQNYNFSETKSLYDASEKPGDMSSARRKNKQDEKATTINKRKTEHSKNQHTDPGLLSCYEKLTQNYADLNSSFQNLSKEYHGFGSYLALLIEDNQKIRAAHLECQMELDAEKEKNAILEARIKEKDGVTDELKMLLQQLKEKEKPAERPESLFPTDQIDRLIEKSDQLVELLNQFSAAPSVRTLPDTKSADSEEDPITDEDLNFMPELTKEELYALQSDNELSETNQFEHEAEEFLNGDLSDYESEFGMPDEETINQINGNTSDVETILYDPEKDDELSMNDEVEDSLSHGIMDANGDEQTISLDPAEKIEIKDHYQEVNKKANAFTSLVRNFEKRRFERKNLAEQKNLLFKKMREYSFEADRIGIVRQIIDAGGSLPTLYTLVENNPDVDVLNGYLAVMKKDMTRVAAGA